MIRSAAGCQRVRRDGLKIEVLEKPGRTGPDDTLGDYNLEVIWRRDLYLFLQCREFRRREVKYEFNDRQVEPK